MKPFERLLWFVAVALGGSLVWWVPHPPLADLPQHAGQIRLLHDMLLGQSPWADQLRINLLTPYLLGYGLALPLTFVMSVTAAIKVLLTVAYVAFVAMCVRLGRHWQCDPRLDWFYVPGFFGFAFGWGFFTFLVASPFGLLFLWLSERYARNATLKNAAVVSLFGVVLLASHGLMFLFCAALGAAIVATLTPVKLWVRRSGPYLLLLMLFMVYFLASRHIAAATDGTPEKFVLWDLRWWRFQHVLAYALTEHPREIGMMVLSSAMLLSPFVIGSRLSLSRRVPILVFCGVLAVLLLAPAFALRTAYLNERFALFVLPTYAWLFAAPRTDGGVVPARGRLGQALLALCACLAIGWHAVQFWRFGREAAPLDAQLQRLEPNQRVFSLIFDNESRAARIPMAYIHYPAWYQAEHGGFAEFNFAWYPPQIVRFRPDHPPIARPVFGWTGDKFEWGKDDGDHATYFFVRRRDPLPAPFFAGAPCPPAVDWQDGEWTIYKRVTDCH